MMDLSDPWLLLSGFAISMSGLALFIHGKKMGNVRNLGIGLAMMVFPILVHSLLLLWVVAGVCVAPSTSPFPRSMGRRPGIRRDLQRATTDDRPAARW